MQSPFYVRWPESGQRFLLFESLRPVKFLCHSLEFSPIKNSLFFAHFS